MPIAYTGSTPPNGTAATASIAALPGPAAEAPRGPPDIWLSTAAPLPGSPTALPVRTPRSPPPPPPANADGASAVRRLGVAMSPPGQSHDGAG